MLQKKRLALFGIVWYLSISLVYIATLYISYNYMSKDIKINNKLDYVSPLAKEIDKLVKDVYISNCLSESKYPYLLSAIAQVESDFRPQIIGDSGDSIGLFQIQEKHWGLVPDSIPDQIKKAEMIFDSLSGGRTQHQMIAKWNGSGWKAERYAKKVERRLHEFRKTKKDCSFR